MSKTVHGIYWGMFSLCTLFFVTACDSGGSKSCPVTTNLSSEICSPTAGPFSIDINNPFLPYPVGGQSVLEGTEDGDRIRVQITVLDETETIAGVETRVVEESEWENDTLIEVSRNFVAQAADGTVCYFGEDVDIYRGGVIVRHSGAWRAGEDDNLPGILMPGTPTVGQIYAQEAAPGIAEDTAEILALGETVTVPAGTFTDTVKTLDTNPMDCDKDTKYYARDAGLIVDGPAKLMSY